ncbi:MAG: peptide ABC transporter substrate-binding protein [Clostridia bacterium]|nr:peptide ABC transporter substrate-binding protein [Clostridia bacterium]
MKRVLALILALVMVVCCFASCSTLKGEDKGAIVTVYLGDQIYDLDPTQSYTNDAVAQLTTLMFEGLTTLDSNGNWKKGMMKSYKMVEGEDGTEKLQITLRETKWSDGRTVQANDFVYAWKRLIEPTFGNDAACLLYDIKNAREIKMGDKTVDDIGVYAVETYVLEIEFAHEVDIDAFLRTVASPALVPLREDKVGQSDEWAKKSSSMVTNGPFDIRKFDINNELRLERSSYYYLDSEKNEALDKYVIPYRLRVLFNLGDEAKQLEKFNQVDTTDDNVYYITDIALASRGEYVESATVSNALNTYSYYFNTENELFADARVRKALSLALDRQAIAEKLVFADAATGFVPAGIADKTVKEDFRANADASGALIVSAADASGANKLLKEAGITPSKYSFTITCRDDETDKAVADMAKASWTALGFKVEVEALGGEQEGTVAAGETAVYKDLYTEAYESGEFDVIAVESQALANDAYAVLAPYATKFSGYGVDMESESYDVVGHVTGYASAEYDELMEAVYNAEGADARSEALHNAEKKLVEDMPAIPVVFQKHAGIVNADVLSGISITFWGTTDFKKVKMKDYMNYKAIIEGVDTTSAEQ